MKKIITAKEAINLISNESRVMIGGFLSCGTPTKLVDELVSQNKTDLTLVANDTSVPNKDRGKLIENHQVKKVITTHIGTNPETGKQMLAGELEVELVPMGTFYERIRAKGSGLGGVLTPTGVGTLVEEFKRTMEVDGETFILDTPIGADFALIYGTKVDKYGNVSYQGTTRNSNVVMATAADTVIVEAEEFVDSMDPNEVIVPGIFVDYIVVREDKE